MNSNVWVYDPLTRPEFIGAIARRFLEMLKRSGGVEAFLTRDTGQFVSDKGRLVSGIEVGAIQTALIIKGNKKLDDGRLTPSDVFKVLIVIDEKTRFTFIDDAVMFSWYDESGDRWLAWFLFDAR